MRKIPVSVKEVLTASGLSWEIVNGGRHLKIFIEGKFCTIMSFGANCYKGRHSDPREKQIIRRINKTVQELKGAENGNGKNTA